MKRLIRLIFVALSMMSAVSTVVCSSSVVHAQDTESKLESMLQKASSDYDVLMIADAKAKLDDALDLADSQSITGPVVADLYVMVGIVEFAQSHSQDKAKQAFISALKQDYEASIPAVYENPALVEAMEDAHQQVEPPATDASAQGGPPEGFRHEPVETAQAGQPMALTVYVPSDMPVFHVFVYHRRFGEQTFEQLEMNADGATEFSVDIPAEQVRTSQIEYYIQAVDRADDVIGQAGSKITPLTTAVMGSTKSSGQAVNDTETPADSGPNTTRPPGDDANAEGPTSGQKAYVLLLGGTGVGFLPGGGSPTAHPDRSVSGGLAPAFGHAMIDVGYMITENAHIGLYFRWQFSPPQDFSQIPDPSKSGGNFATTRQECLGLGLPGDCLLGLKYRWFFRNDDGVRLYSSTGAGIGRIRSWLRLKQPYLGADGVNPSAQCGGKERVDGGANGDYCYVRDTVRPGWAHFGAGVGAMWPVQQHIDIVLDSYLTVLFPDTGVNLDVNLGLNMRF